MFVLRIDYKECGCGIRAILRHEGAIPFLVVAKIEPDKLSGVPGEIGVGQQVSHQVTR
jgi:hypothetical protein